MKQNTLFLMLLVVAGLGLAFLGTGISGMVTVTQQANASCVTNNQTGQTCCYVYREQSGVRDSANMCVTFADLTPGEKQQIVLADPTIRSERMQSYAWEFIGGLLVLLTTIVVLLYVRKRSAPHAKSA